MRSESGGAEVYLQMQPGETRVLRTFADQTTARPRLADHRSRTGEPIAVDGPWRVQFVEGGPELPAEATTDELKCWTATGSRRGRTIRRSRSLHNHRASARLGSRSLVARLG